MQAQGIPGVSPCQLAADASAGASESAPVSWHLREHEGAPTSQQQTKKP